MYALLLNYDETMQTFASLDLMVLDIGWSKFLKFSPTLDHFPSLLLHETWKCYIQKLFALNLKNVGVLENFTVNFTEKFY